MSGGMNRITTTTYVQPTHSHEPSYVMKQPSHRKEKPKNETSSNSNQYSCHPSAHQFSLCKMFETKSKENQIQFEKHLRTEEDSVIHGAVTMHSKIATILFARFCGCPFS